MFRLMPNFKHFTFTFLLIKAFVKTLCNHVEKLLVKLKTDSFTHAVSEYVRLHDLFIINN